MKSLLWITALITVTLAPLAPAQSPKPAATHSFAEGAAHNGIAEVVMSNLALQKSRQHHVQSLSMMMINHHTSANMELMKLMAGESAMLPVTPNPEQMQAIQRLQGLSGAAFERAYLDHQVQAHEKAVALFEQGAQGPSTELKRFAEEKLPLLRAHLEITRRYANQQRSAGGTR